MDKIIKTALDNVLMVYLEKGLDGNGIEAQINLLKASIAKEVIIHVKGEIAVLSRLQK